MKQVIILLFFIQIHILFAQTAPFQVVLVPQDFPELGGLQSYAYGQANTGTVLAQATYNQANVTIGVDTTQNTRITVLEGVKIPELKGRINKLIANKIGVNLGFDL